MLASSLCFRKPKPKATPQPTMALLPCTAVGQPWVCLLEPAEGLTAHNEGIAIGEQSVATAEGQLCDVERLIPGCQRLSVLSH